MLKDKCVLITGAGQGIGREVALGLARDGARIIIADIDDAKLLETVSEIHQSGGTATGMTVDLSSLDSIDNLMKRIENEVGSLDILVNVAGVCLQEDFFETTENTWDLTMNVNLKGLFFLSKSVAEGMVKNKQGKIINVASTSSYITSSKCMVAYDVSKAAVKMLTTVMAEWLGPYQINVNAIAPATTKTKMVTDLFGEDYWEGDWVSTKYPLGRIADPVDHLNAIRFLCSADASYVNGHTLLVDGGCLLAYRRPVKA